MGTDSADSRQAVVADAGPLIHLDELAALSVLGDLGEIIVVSAVREELRNHRQRS